jgi:hypothetical protein
MPLCCTTQVPVVSERVVYLELQKTASTLIGSVLVDLFGAEHRSPKHGLLPADCRDRFVIGSVRNPWDYYVSLWSFGGEGEGGLHKRLTQRHLRRAWRALPDLGPLLAELRRQTARWQSTYAEPHTPERFRGWLSRVHDARRAAEIEARYGASELRHVAGYATYRYCRLYSGSLESVLRASTPTDLRSAAAAAWLPDAFIRMENLTEDLLDAVREAGYRVDDVLERAVREHTEIAVNRSQHRSYTDYYDESSRRLVAERDALLIERHEYAFGS